MIFRGQPVGIGPCQRANVPPAGAGQAPAAQGGVANVIPGLTYSDAAGNSLESAYAAYRQNRQGN